MKGKGVVPGPSVVAVKSLKKKCIFLFFFMHFSSVVWSFISHHQQSSSTKFPVESCCCPSNKRNKQHCHESLGIQSKWSTGRCSQLLGSLGGDSGDSRDDGDESEIIGDGDLSTLFKKLEQIRHFDMEVLENWKCGNFEYFQTFSGKTQVSAVQLADPLLAIGFENGEVHIVDLNTGEPAASLTPVDGPVTALAWDGAALLAAVSVRASFPGRGGCGGVVRCWFSPLAPGGYADQHAVTFPAHPDAFILGLARVPSATGGVRFASAGTDGRVAVWDSALGLSAPVFEVRLPAPALCLGQAGGYLTAGLLDGRVVAYSAARAPSPSAPPLLVIQAHKGAVTALHFTEENFLVTGGQDGRVLVWNLFDGGDHDRDTVAMELPGDYVRVLNRRFEGHSGAITALQADCNKIVSASTDGAVKVWDITTGQILFEVYGDNSVCCIHYDSKTLVTDGVKNSAIVYNFAVPAKNTPPPT